MWLNSSVWAEGIAPEAYEDVKFNATKATPPESCAYTGGLYCPENTTATSTASLAGGLDLTGTLNSTQAEIPRLVTTHLLVAAKFVPKLVRNDDTCRCGSTCRRHLLYQRE